MYEIKLDPRDNPARKIENVERIVSAYGPQSTIVAMGNAFASREIRIRQTAEEFADADKNAEAAFLRYVASKYSRVADTLRELAMLELGL